jgi:uncharacterized protein
MRLLFLPSLAFVVATTHVTTTHAFEPFAPIDTSFWTREHIVPGPPVQSTILLRANVTPVTNHLGQVAPAKEWNDFIGYIPIDGRSDSGYVISNNETDVINNVHGDGGGMIVFTAHFKDNMWSVADHPNGNFRSVDFGPVGGTIANCGGGVTPWGTVLTGEEWMQNSNSALYNNGNRYRDTTDWHVPIFNGEIVDRHIRRHQNMNWIVEVDVENAVALKKHYNMGRYAHEVGYPMPDGRTVYLTDDATPAVLFKFVSVDSGSYDVGQLYAYQQSGDGETGSWLPMPMQLDSMINARGVALRMGATAFTRHEWVVEADGYLYITETGNDNSGTAHRNAVRNGATLARHLAERLEPDSSIVDYFGRILRLNLTTNKLDVLLEGGPGEHTVNHLSNPDGLTKVRLANKTYLVIQEDLNGTSQGRVPPAVHSAGRYICEMYWLDLAIENPTVDDLKRFMVGPHGAEITGARFTPDGKTMFVNLQHPSSGNPAPYNTSYTMAVWGYEAPAGLLFDHPTFEENGKFDVKVNAMSRLAYFSEVTDVELYNVSGRRLERHRGVRMIDIAHLSPGQYVLRFKNGETHRMLLQ